MSDEIEQLRMLIAKADSMAGRISEAVREVRKLLPRRRPNRFAQSPDWAWAFLAASSLCQELRQDYQQITSLVNRIAVGKIAEREHHPAESGD